MRITNKSVYFNYLGQLENIQSSKYKEEIRLTTGKRITGIEEEPERLNEIKILQSRIAKNTNYINILEETLSEMRVASENMDFISDTLKRLRQTAIDALSISASTSPQTFASQIKDLLNDIIGQANKDYNGKTLFSGTATTPQTLVAIPPDDLVANNDLPFELIEEVPPSDPINNPSGLRVIFKGNNNDRLINKDQYTEEITNVKSEELFGSGYEPQLFQDIIKIYNIIKFKSDGSLRTETDQITTAEINQVDTLQKTLLDHDQKISNTIALFGAKYNRLDSLVNQLLNDNIRLQEINSIKSDTDIARTTIELRKNETALQYSLQVGARIMQTSLFDFLR